jgi:hypothetical protein
MICPCQRHHFGGVQPVNMAETRKAFRDLMAADAENADLEVSRTAKSARRYAFVALRQKGLAERISASKEGIVYRATDAARTLNSAKTTISFGDATAVYAGSKGDAKVYNVTRANGKKIGKIVEKRGGVRWETRLQSGAADSVANALAFVVEATLPKAIANPTIDNAPFGSKILTPDGQEITSAQARQIVIDSAVRDGRLFAYHGENGTIQTWDGLTLAHPRVISRQETPNSSVSNERIWMRFRAPWDKNRIWSGFTLGPTMYGRFRRTKLNDLNAPFGGDAEMGAREFAKSRFGKIESRGKSRFNKFVSGMELIVTQRTVVSGGDGLYRAFVEGNGQSVLLGAYKDWRGVEGAFESWAQGFGGDGIEGGGCTEPGGGIFGGDVIEGSNTLIADGWTNTGWRSFSRPTANGETKWRLAWYGQKWRGKTATPWRLSISTNKDRWFADTEAAMTWARVNDAREGERARLNAIELKAMGFDGDAIEGASVFPRVIGGQTNLAYPGFYFAVKKVDASRYSLSLVNNVSGSKYPLLDYANAPTIKKAANAFVDAVNHNVENAGRPRLDAPFGDDDFGAAYESSAASWLADEFASPEDLDLDFEQDEIRDASGANAEIAGGDEYGGVADIRRWNKVSSGRRGENQYVFRTNFANGRYAHVYHILPNSGGGYYASYREGRLTPNGDIALQSNDHGVFMRPQDAARAAAMHYEKMTGLSARAVPHDQNFGAKKPDPKKKKGKKCAKPRYVAKVNGKVIGRFTKRQHAVNAVNAVKELLADARVRVQDDVIEENMDDGGEEEMGGTYKNIDTLARASEHGYVTLDNINTGRIHNKRAGWTDHGIRLTEHDASGIANALGGHRRTQAAVTAALLGGAGSTLSMSTAERIMYEPGRGWRYVAGQSYPDETARIRRALTR